MKEKRTISVFIEDIWESIHCLKEQMVRIRKELNQ